MKRKIFTPLHPAESVQRSWSIGFWLTLAALLLASVGLGLLSLYFGSLYPVWARLASYFAYPMLLLRNLAPVVLACLLLYVLSNRAWCSFLLTAVVVVLLTYANHFKVVLRADVVVFTDVQYFFSAVKILGEYSITLTKKFYLGIALCLGASLLLGLLCRGRFPAGRGGQRLRFLLLAALLAVGMFGYRALYVSQEDYDSFENYTLFNRWSDNESYVSHGFLYAFLHSAATLAESAPEGYSPTTAKALLQEDWSIPEGQEVNFLCIMLESFSDLSVYDSVNFTQDAYAAFHALAEQSLSGTLLVDTFGGGTVNTERSFLTGFTTLDSFRHAVWSYPRWFSEQGYTVTGSHPGHQSFYNRQNVNLNLGFTGYLFMENYYQQFTQAEYAYDDILLPALAQQLQEATASGTPYFNFSVSYQNHSPYSSTCLTGEEYVSHAGLSDAAYYTVNNYLSGIADTGNRLLALAEELEALEEPVVLLLFGDHKPTLGASNAYYEELGINLHWGYNDEGFLNYYSTPYLIWANSAAKDILGEEFCGEGPTISPAFLMAELFAACGWEGPAFAQLTQALMEVCPVVQASGKYMDAQGNLSSEIPAAAQQLLERYNYCQYYLRTTVAR